MVAVRLALVLAFAFDAGACLCDFTSLKSDYKTAAAVFIATTATNEGGAIQLHVERTWKGPYKPGDVMPALLPTGESCDFNFRDARTYLVFAFDESPHEHYRVLECTHTGNVADERVQQSIKEIQRKHRWWDNPLSSIGWRGR